MLHFTWAVVIIFDQSSIKATAVDALYYYISDPMILSSVLVIAAILAMFGLTTRSMWVLLLLIPQQTLVLMSASGALEAIWLGQFADGEIRPVGFLLVDQVHSVYAAMGHTVAIIIHAHRVITNGHG